MIDLETGEITETSEQSTAIAKRDPRQDPAIIALGDQAQRIGIYAISLQIQSPGDAKTAADELSAVTLLKKRLDAFKHNYKAPLLEYARNLDNIFALIAGPLDQANSTIRKKLLDYQAEEQRRQQEEQALATPFMSPEPSDPPPKATIPTRARLGTVSYVAQVDKAAVDKAIAGGIAAIPGIHIWFEPRWKVLDIKKVPAEYKHQATRLPVPLR